MAKKNLEEVILGSFEGSNSGEAFSNFNSGEYIGYVTATVRLQNLSMNVSLLDVLNEVRRLFDEGAL